MFFPKVNPSLKYLSGLDAKSLKDRHLLNLVEVLYFARHVKNLLTTISLPEMPLYDTPFVSRAR